MPPAMSPRRTESRRDGTRGGWIFPQQKRADLWIGQIGFVKEVDERARDGIGRLRESDQAVDGFSKFRGAARTMAHLAGDEARIDGASAHDAGERGSERTGARTLRVGHIPHDQIATTSKRGCACRKT